MSIGSRDYMHCMPNYRKFYTVEKMLSSLVMYICTCKYQNVIRVFFKSLKGTIVQKRITVVLQSMKIYGCGIGPPSEKLI